MLINIWTLLLNFDSILDGSLLPDALYTLCLDSIGDEDNLYLHVSKPPKEGSPGDTFYKVHNPLYYKLAILLYFLRNVSFLIF